MLHRNNAAVFVNFVVLLLLLTSHGAAQSSSGPETAAAAQVAQVAQELPAQRPTLRTAVVSTLGLQLDGLLSEPAWSEAESISNLITIEPQEGGVPAGKTVVKVLANTTEMVIGVICQRSGSYGHRLVFQGSRLGAR